MPWVTMRHKGVNLPPLYTPTGKIKYKGEYIPLPPLCEEYLVYWFRLKLIHRNDPVVQQNFLKDIKKIQGKARITDDFLKDRSIRAQCIKMGHNFTYREKVSNIVKVDNVKYSVNNNIDIPGVFIGKGNHPSRGKIKRRVQTKDITVNGTCPSKAHDGQSWGHRVQSNESYYIACWKDPLFNKMKYIYVTSDQESKYIECQKIKRFLNGIRRKIDEDLVSPDTRIRKLACIVYMIDKLCFRVGHEKDEQSSDSVGCCTLLNRNVKVLPGDQVEFDFFGKSYIRFKKRVKLDTNVVKVIKECTDLGSESDELFDTSAVAVNNYLDKLKPGLTAKMFRTCNASTLCYRLLKNRTTLEELKEVFVKVATLCNHKRKKKNTYVIDTMTTKKNYIDPRIVYAFCHKHGINVNSVYSEALQEQHKWASSVPDTFMY